MEQQAEIGLIKNSCRYIQKNKSIFPLQMDNKLFIVFSLWLIDLTSNKYPFKQILFSLLQYQNMAGQVFIKNLQGNSCIIKVDIQRSLVKDLINDYIAKTGQKEQNVNLIYVAKSLMDHKQKKLYELGIQNNSTIFSVIRLKGGNKVKIIINDVNNKQHNIEFDDDKTGRQLKQYIYKYLCQSLEATLMSIQYAGVQIQNQKKLSSYKLVQTSGVRKIIQNKVGLGQIAGIILAYEVDSLGFQQNDTVRMPCGHVVGTQGMTAFIRSLVDSNQFSIKCPAKKPNGQDCHYEWDYYQCRKIGVFTAEENQAFQEGLSKNWLTKNSSQCPKCLRRVIKGQLKSNRVRCPKCNYGDYCYNCSHLWKSSGFEFCGNQNCNYINQFLQNLQWDRPFKLKKDGKEYTYMLPKYRLCPQCNALIQITEGCKHMNCKNCKKAFCWVCLQSKVSGSWTCGGYTDFCGKIAQTQQFVPKH